MHCGVIKHNYLFQKIYFSVHTDFEKEMGICKKFVSEWQGVRYMNQQCSSYKELLIVSTNDSY